MKNIIGSSSEDGIGVGTIIRWRADEILSIDRDPTRERGTY